MNQTKETKLIALGYVGLGKHADECLLPSILHIPEAYLHTITSRDPNKLEYFARRYKVEHISNDWLDLINSEEIKGIIVSGPPQLHFEVAKKALENNKNIFVEKPPTDTIEHLKELIEIEQKSESKVFVGYNFTYSEAFNNLIKPLSSNIKLVRMKFVSGKPLSKGYFSSVFDYSLYSMLVHPLHTSLSLLKDKEITNIQSFSRVHNDPRFSMELIIETKDTTIIIDWGNYSNRFEFDFEVIDENNCVGRMHDLFQYEYFNTSNSFDIPFAKGKQRTVFDYSLRDSGYKRNGYLPELTHWVNSFSESNSLKFKNSFKDSLQVYSIIEKVKSQNSNLYNLTPLED